MQSTEERQAFALRLNRLLWEINRCADDLDAIWGERDLEDQITLLENAAGAVEKARNALALDLVEWPRHGITPLDE